MTSTRSISPLPVALQTLSELEARLFRDAAPGALRGWSDAFSGDELLAIAARDDFRSFPAYVQSAIYSALDRSEGIFS